MASALPGATTAGAFWSVTVYNIDQSWLADNEIDRYSWRHVQRRLGHRTGSASTVHNKFSLILIGALAPEQLFDNFWEQL
jgi:uncharacterized protein DUF1214